MVESEHRCRIHLAPLVELGTCGEADAGYTVVACPYEECTEARVFPRPASPIVETPVWRGMSVGGKVVMNPADTWFLNLDKIYAMAGQGFARARKGQR